VGSFGRHLRGDHELPGISPGAALVVDDLRYVGVAENAAEARQQFTNGSSAN
jgi:hypothetical protein